jgi:hypothetical protein
MRKQRTSIVKQAHMRHSDEAKARHYAALSGALGLAALEKEIL